MNINVVDLPQLGVNDISSTMVEWHKKDEDFIKKGELICCVETTKSIFDLEAISDGYLTIIKDIGSNIDKNEIIALISDEIITKEYAQDWLKSFATEQTNLQESASSVDNEGKNITQKALLLINKYNIDINKITSEDARITEADVMTYLETSKHSPDKNFNDSVDDVYPVNRVQRIAIVGAGKGAVQVIDTLLKIPDQRAVMLFDDDKDLLGKTVMGVPVVGPIDADIIENMYKQGKFDAVIISISTSVKFRTKVFEQLNQKGIKFANVIHPTVCTGANVSIGSGNVILAFCHIGACAIIGDNNFLSAYCSIEHHSILSNNCSFGPGVITSSRVHFGDRVRCGTGIFIESFLKIGHDSIIGSGCIVWKDIPPKKIAKTQLNYILRDLE